jgi:hypothetical protein
MTIKLMLVKKTRKGEILIQDEIYTHRKQGRNDLTIADNSNV